LSCRRDAFRAHHCWRWVGYDADSNVTSRKTRAGATITLTYDSLNRLATKTAPSEPTVTYSYDLAGRPTGFTDNSASIVIPTTTGTIGTLTSTYDSLNHLSSSSWGPTVAQSAFYGAECHVHLWLRCVEPRITGIAVTCTKLLWVTARRHAAAHLRSPGG
jgi:YD repeat-containing protein